MTRLLKILAAALVLVALLAGCSSKAERLYRRAEAFLAQGQFEMAATEYQRLVDEHSRSPLVDDALYKLAYVHAEELGRPSAALVQYRALADDHPNSPYADDALMRVMTIQREVLHDPAAVRRTWIELCERYKDRRTLCARGMLEVGHAHFESGDYPLAAAVGEELTEKYSDQVRQCAQAALLRARATERMDVEQAEVEKLYEQVIKQYPDTHAAAVAKRNIGWIYYGKKEEQEQQRAKEIERRSRIIGGVPAHDPQDAPIVQAVAALRSALAHRGEERSLQHLVALAGTPFVIIFDPARPRLAQSALDGSPFEIVADALGFAHNTWSDTSAENAFGTVHHALLQGHPILVRYGSPPQWVIVTGFKVAQERVYLMPPGRDDYVTVDRGQFLARWKEASGSGSGVAGSEPFHQFSLGARLRTTDRNDLLTATVRRAVQVMQQTSVAGAPAGSAAWKAAGHCLEMCVAPEDTNIREQAAGWVNEGLKPQLTIAEMGTAALREAEQLSSELSGIANRHEEMLQEARLVARKIDEAHQAEEEASVKWQAAAAQANYVAALHTRLAEQLAGVVSGDEELAQSLPTASSNR